jgi:anti-anti-sigma factor
VIDDLADLEVDRTPEFVLVTIRGEVDLSNADAILRRIFAATVPTVPLVVDLGGIRYMDSCGVRLLYELVRLTSGAKLSVVAPSESVARQLFEVTRLADVVPVVESVSDVG